jgi:hypothetical protein
MQVILIESVSQVMGLYAKEVHHLSKSCIDFLLWDFYTLGSSQSEPTYSGDFINRLDRKDLADVARLLESTKQLLNSLCFISLCHPLVLLQHELLLILIKILPKAGLLLLNLLIILLEVLDLYKLIIFFSL